MYKLSGQSLTRGTWFLPETQPMIIQERDSTSTITLGPEAPEIQFDDWLLDDDWQEGDYVWRVKNITDDTNTDTRTVELEHIVKTLDDITLGEVTVETIAGAGAKTCTAKQAVQYILSKHDAWTLGDFEYDVSNPYEFDGETLLDALETVTDTLEYAVWEFNLSTFPFKLHVRQRDNTVRCEMRGERNLITLKRSISRSGMYTRIYPTGKNGLQLDSGYLSKNENLYGRVDHRETDQSKSTKDNLQAWARGRLNRHCEPRVTIQISGLELSQETGEPLDSLTMNKVCQCPLPEYSTTITERIVKKQWRDRRKEPENVNVTLANNVTDITTIVKEQVRGGSGGRAGAGQAKQNYLFEANGEHLLYEVFDECGHVHGLLRMTSESLRIAFENLNDSTRSEFMLTAESLRIQFENEISSTRSQFEMTSESLRIEFQNTASSLRSEFQMSAQSLRIEFNNEASSLRSEFQLTAQSLRIEFNNEASSLRGSINATAESLTTLYTKTGVNSLGVGETLYSKVTQTAEALTSKVGKGEISSTINQTAQSVLIQASKINLEGYVTVSSLDAVDAKIGNLMSGVTTASLLKATTLQASSFSFNGDSARWGTLSLGNLKSMTVMTHSIQNQDLDHYHGITISESDGVITVEIGAAASSAGTDSFNMADTAFYQNAVSAAIASVKVRAADITEYQEAYYNSTTHNTTVYIEAAATNGQSGRQTFHVSGAEAYAAGEAHANSQYTQVSVTPIKATSAIRINETPVTLYEAGSGTKYDRGTGLTARPVVSSGGTIFYEANSQATYRQAGSGTKYDRGTGLTARPVVSSGGTVFYTAGTAVTRYKAGTAVTRYKGNGGSFTVQGSQVSVTPIRATSAIRLGTRTSIDGKYYYPVVSSGGTIYYQANAATTYYQAGTTTKYARGDSESITPIGDSESITPIGSTSVRLGSAATYYPGDGGAFTPQGAEVVVTPIKATSAIRLGAAATYYPGDGGAFTPQGAEVVVTPIKATSAIRLGGAGTYYPGDGGSFTPQGSAQDAYKKVSSGGTIYYQANPAATYYTKNE